MPPTPHDEQPVPDELTRAAVRVFVRRGFEGARMSEVAAEMGGPLDLLYEYVQGKLALYELVVLGEFGAAPLPAGGALPHPTPSLRALRRRMEGRIRKLLRFRRLERAPTRTDPAVAVEECRGVLTELCRRCREDGTEMRFYARTAPGLPEGLSGVWSRSVGELLDRLVRYLEAGISTGALRDLGAPRPVARFVLRNLGLDVRSGRSRERPDPVVRESDCATGVRILVAALLNDTGEMASGGASPCSPR